MTQLVNAELYTIQTRLVLIPMMPCCPPDPYPDHNHTTPECTSSLLYTESLTEYLTLTISNPIPNHL